MDCGKSLKEIEDQLPSGFHDAYLEAVTVDFVANAARLDMQLSVGDPDALTSEERDAYRRATLWLTGLVYFVVEAPGPNGEWWAHDGLRIDAGDARDDSNPAAPRPLVPLPNGVFAYWFFVSDWNAFIHVAARKAALEWK
jgi:hypothetical protein